MKDELETAREDLVFLKALVTEGGPAQSSLGFVLFAAGMIYGIHTLLIWLIELQLLPRQEGISGLIFASTPTLLFLSVLTWTVRRDRKNSNHAFATRTLNAAFGGAGLASLTTAIIFGYLAISRGDVFIWLFHPITTFVIQGTVWYIAYVVRRRLWLALVSLCWHATAIALAVLLNLGMTNLLILVLALGLLLLMALPGWVLWRSSPARI